MLQSSCSCACHLSVLLLLPQLEKCPTRLLADLSDNNVVVVLIFTLYIYLLRTEIWLFFNINCTPPFLISMTHSYSFHELKPSLQFLFHEQVSTAWLHELIDLNFNVYRVLVCFMFTRPLHRKIRSGANIQKMSLNIST